jgi:putative peptide zinc metalloprotease protein
MTDPTLLAPTLATGVSLLGEYQGSGFTEPHYLIVRADQQVLHVSRLLFVVASHLDGRSSMEEIAERVSTEYGRTLDADGVRFLVTAKLRPMGIAAEAGAGTEDVAAVEHVAFGLPVAGSPPPPRPAPAAREPREPRPAPEPREAPPPAPPAPAASPARLLPRANPLLALRFRGTLIPASATRFLARLLAPLFYGPVIALGILGLVVADVWLLRQASLTDAVDSILVDPPMLLSVIGILLAATVVHELGHAAACRYGGAAPGKIGVAVYIVYPAFFTDVTQSYRLGRAGRVRTDLGGVYFNALTIAGLTAVYAHTHSPAVLLAIVFVHVEALQQLLPLGRLDGYFVVADLVGVPDLFGRIGPILRSALPGRRTDPKVAELRRSARVVVTLWVAVTGPIMVGILAYMLWSAPSITAQVIDAMSREWTLLQASVEALDAAGITLAALSLVLLPLPLLGLAWLVGGILRRIVAAAVRPLRRHRHRPPTVGPAYRPQPEEIPMSGSDPTPPTATADRPLPPAWAGASAAPAPPAAPVAPAPPLSLPAPVFTRTADELTERFLLRAQPRTPDTGGVGECSP